MRDELILDRPLAAGLRLVQHSDEPPVVLDDLGSGYTPAQARRMAAAWGEAARLAEQAAAG